MNSTNEHLSWYLFKGESSINCKVLHMDAQMVFFTFRKSHWNWNNKLALIKRDTDSPCFTAKTDLGSAHSFLATGKKIHLNATVKYTQCVSDQGDQRDIDTNHTEKVTVYLILCIRALAALNLSSPPQYSPSFSSCCPELYEHSFSFV